MCTFSLLCVYLPTLISSQLTSFTTQSPTMPDAEVEWMAHYDSSSRNIFLMGAAGPPQMQPLQIESYNIDSNTFDADSYTASEPDPAVPNTENGQRSVGIGNSLYFTLNGYLSTFNIVTQTFDFTFSSLPNQIKSGCMTKDDQDKYIFIMGGKLITDDTTVSNQFMVYKISPGSWLNIANSPTLSIGRLRFGCNFYNNLIYIFGGATVDATTYTNSIETFDTTNIENGNTAIWSILNGQTLSASYGDQRAVHVFPTDHFFYIIGGYSAASPATTYDNIEIFDLRYNTISLSGVSLAAPRASPGVIAVDGFIYVFGGWSSGLSITWEKSNYITAAPTTAIPTTASPTSIPTTSIPTTNIPTTSIPTTTNPTPFIPTTSLPTTSAPTTAIPTTSIPTTNIPTTISPTTTFPTTFMPTTFMPTTFMPTTNIPTTFIPTTNSPSTDAPTTSMPTTYTPTTYTPTTYTPTTYEPTTYTPTTSTTATANPTSNPTAEPSENGGGIVVETTLNGNVVTDNGNKTIGNKSSPLTVYIIILASVLLILSCCTIIACVIFLKQRNKTLKTEVKIVSDSHIDITKTTTTTMGNNTNGGTYNAFNSPNLTSIAMQTDLPNDFNNMMRISSMSAASVPSPMNNNDIMPVTNGGLESYANNANDTDNVWTGDSNDIDGENSETGTNEMMYEQGGVTKGGFDDDEEQNINMDVNGVTKGEYEENEYGNDNEDEYEYYYEDEDEQEDYDKMYKKNCNENKSHVTAM